MTHILAEVKTTGVYKTNLCACACAWACTNVSSRVFYPWRRNSETATKLMVQHQWHVEIYNHGSAFFHISNTFVFGKIRAHFSLVRMIAIKTYSVQFITGTLVTKKCCNILVYVGCACDARTRTRTRVSKRLCLLELYTETQTKFIILLSIVFFLILLIFWCSFLYSSTGNNG